MSAVTWFPRRAGTAEPVPPKGTYVNLMPAALLSMVVPRSFADEVPLYRSYVADVERGSRNVGLVNALRIAQALGLSLSQLIADAEQGDHSP